MNRVTDGEIVKIFKSKSIRQSEVDLLNFEELVKYFSTLKNRGYVIHLAKHHVVDNVRGGLVYPEYGEYARFDISSVEQQLADGRDPKKIYDEAFVWIHLSSLKYDGALVKFFKLLCEYGYPVKSVDEFVESVARDRYADISGGLLWDIFIVHPMDWVDLGINPRKYIQQFLDRFGLFYIKGVYAIGALPECIKPRELVDHFTMREIMEANSKVKNGFYNFLTRVKEADKNYDFKTFAKRFVKRFKGCKNKALIKKGKCDLMCFMELRYPDVDFSEIKS